MRNAQLTPPRRGQRREVLPSAREVLLARLLLHVIDVLGNREDMPVDLYDAVKAIAEPIVREAPRGPAA